MSEPRVMCICGIAVLPENWSNHLLRQDRLPHGRTEHDRYAEGYAAALAAVREVVDEIFQPGDPGPIIDPDGSRGWGQAERLIRRRLVILAAGER